VDIDEAIEYSEFLHRQALHLSRKPRDENGKLLRAEDTAMARSLHGLVDEHEKICRRLLHRE
jgi:hypothetical protein